MNAHQKSQLNSLLSVVGYLEQNKAVITGSKFIVDQVEVLKGKIALINTLTEEQERNQKGKAISKKNSRDLLIESMLGVGGAVRGLAIVNGDPELAERVHMKKRDLQHLGPKLTERAAKLNELAGEHAEALAGLVSAEDLKELADRKSSYEALVVSPREAIARRKTVTALLKTEVKATMTLLRDVLDPALTIFRESNEEFYLGYRNARYIVDAPTRTREISTVATNQAAPIGANVVGIDGDTYFPDAEIETAAVATPSRIAAFVDVAPSRVNGANGIGAHFLPEPELVN